MNSAGERGFDAQAMMATVRDLVALAPRLPGTPGGEAAADYVAERFRAAGLSDVGFEEVPTLLWECPSASLRVGDVEIPCAPIRHCLVPTHDATGSWSTPTGGLPAEVVDVGASRIKGGRFRDHDVSGKIVLFDLTFTATMASMGLLAEWAYDPARPKSDGGGRRMLRRDVLGTKNPYISNLCAVFDAAIEGGAVGVIGVLRDYPESLGYHNEHYRKHLFSLPGVFVTRAGGRQLRGMLADSAHAVMDMQVRREQTTARTVVGFLPGRTRETVMVQSHHDSIGPGAVEDGTGVAEVLALAEYYGSLAGERDKTLMFVTFDTHFTGYQAHQEFIRKYVLDAETPYRIVANVTLEHIGLRAVRDPDGSFAVTGDTEPRGIFETMAPSLKVAMIKAIHRHRLHATMMLNAAPLEFSSIGIPTDASFAVVGGVPTVSLVSGPLYLYDDCDTIEKVDVDQLVPVARAFVDVLDAIEATPSWRIGMIPTPLRRLLPRGRW